MAEEPRPPPQSELEPGAPIPPDAVDPELIRLPVPLPRRHPGVAIAVLIVGGLLLYRLAPDLRYAVQSHSPRDFKGAAEAHKSGQLASAIDQYVTVAGLPDHRNGLAFDPKGGRSRVQVFRLLGTSTRLFVAATASPIPPFIDRWSGRLRRFDDVSYADALRGSWQQTQVLRAVDLAKLRALPAGGLPAPLDTVDRAGEPLRIEAKQDLLIDVLFDDDVRVLLSKDKFPSEGDARHEVERLGLAHGPGVETKDGYGYVLRLPPKGPERQRLVAAIDAQGIWLWHRIETYRVPATAVQVMPVGLSLPGPDALQQPVRYMEQGAPEPAPGPAGTPSAPRQLVPQKEPSTVLLWEQVQAVQVSEPLTVPSDALLLLDGDTPKAVTWTLPLAFLLLLFMGWNVWYLIRSLRRQPA
jgi:hypothetical protein